MVQLTEKCDVKEALTHGVYFESVDAFFDGLWKC